MENRTRGEHERQDPHTPHFSCRKTGNTPLSPQAASSYLQPILAKQLFIYFLVFIRPHLGMDQPAVRVLQVLVHVLVFIQRLWGSEGQFS